jgi:predicted DNA-binding ribbon-helix-helix protein
MRQNLAHVALEERQGFQKKRLHPPGRAVGTNPAPNKNGRFRGVMAEKRSFYRDLTEIAESRIKELIQQAEEIEAPEHSSFNAASYVRACAVTVYLAWRDVTDGLHDDNDVERLETLTNGISLVNYY